MRDKFIEELLLKEDKRQREELVLIASENYASSEVRALCGSIFTNKYAEGYGKKRFYSGCENVNEIEQLAKDRACKLFKMKYANVQPHSGTQANMAVMLALLNPGDRVLSMSLSSGGHLSHGFKSNFSGQLYNFSFYSLNEDEILDYDNIEKIALEVKPKLIICGASSYSRAIDFKRFKEIADKVGALLLADISHISGLVATGLHPSSSHADIVTTTTHKTLRGPRGGLILSNDLEIHKKINRAIFPGLQGGPFMNIIAAKAVAFREAMQEEFRNYQLQVLKNAKALAKYLSEDGYRVVSNTTDNHLFLLDLSNKNIVGSEVQELLSSVNISLNKNVIPFDRASPLVCSGIRLGTPALTTRGLKERDMKLVSQFINDTIVNRNNREKLLNIREQVIEFASSFETFKW